MIHEALEPSRSTRCRSGVPLRRLAPPLAVLFWVAGCAGQRAPADTAAKAAPCELATLSLPACQLPEVALRVWRPSPPPPRGLHQKAYDFTDDWFSYRVPVWDLATAPFKGRPGLRYLEVGAYEGRSALWMVENVLTDPGATATLIDPCLGDHAPRLRANIARSGAQSRIRLIEDFSQVALRALPLESFDIIYIDGSHVAADVLEDAVLSWRLLRKGGLLMFDDYVWTGRGETVPASEQPGPAINVFYAFYGGHFTVVHRGYQAILQKK